MAALDWSQCPAVESITGKVSGAWVFKGTRLPVVTVIENLEDPRSTRSSSSSTSRATHHRPAHSLPAEPGSAAHQLPEGDPAAGTARTMNRFGAAPTW